MVAKEDSVLVSSSSRVFVLAVKQAVIINDKPSKDNLCIYPPKDTKCDKLYRIEGQNGK